MLLNHGFKIRNINCYGYIQQFTSNAQQLVKNLEDYTVAVDELLATENILDDNEIVDMVLVNAQLKPIQLMTRKKN
ncbi:hypothetical protein G9A89_015089 [Geosiphon pyriformis]|nr:hypothetical protein G9A89_015089 [Geosiphon pyriformis]